MKTKLFPKIILGLAAIAAISAAPRASAVPITFSGGNGTPLSLTLSQQITYTATSACVIPSFVFQGVGNIFSSSGSFTSNCTITFSVNSGPTTVPIFVGSGLTGGRQTASDLFFYSDIPVNIGVGDIITLNIGTLITFSNVARAGASGSYNTFIADVTGNRVSTDGTSGSSVPETLSTLWLGVPLLGMFAACRLRTGVREH